MKRMIKAHHEAAQKKGVKVGVTPQVEQGVHLTTGWVESDYLQLRQRRGCAVGLSVTQQRWCVCLCCTLCLLCCRLCTAAGMTRCPLTWVCCCWQTMHASNSTSEPTDPASLGVCVCTCMHVMRVSDLWFALTPAVAATTHTHARRGLSQAYGLAVDARGGFSGGTIASGFNQAEAEAPADVAALMADKYFLLPQDAA